LFVRRVPEARAAIAEALPNGAALIAGTFRLNVDPAIPDERIKSYRIYNIAVAYGDDGRLLALYDKLHLVPFGEYLPAPELLKALGLENLTRTRGGMASGRGPRPVIELPGLPPLEILICYEAIFPEEVATGSPRPGVLVNVTNDAWFGLTTGPYQHFHQARLRAVEQGLPLVRSANNGISAIVDPVGRVTASLSLDASGVIDHGLPRPAAPPPYAHLRGWSDLFIAIFMLGWFLTDRNRRTLQSLKRSFRHVAPCKAGQCRWLFPALDLPSRVTTAIGRARDQSAVGGGVSGLRNVK
jgi:apolipoprotein N-acyltransferase